MLLFKARSVQSIHNSPPHVPLLRQISPNQSSPFKTAHHTYLFKGRSIQSSPVHSQQPATCSSPKPDQSNAIQYIHNSTPHVFLQSQISPVQSIHNKSPNVPLKTRSFQSTPLTTAATCPSPNPDQSIPVQYI
jgi:hypothetical protein